MGAAADIRVLSNSWGGTEFSQALLDQIAVMNDNDMLFVAAAGNYGVSNDILPIYPASFTAPNIVSVAATTNTDARAYFSNYGAGSVHLGAPGHGHPLHHQGRRVRVLERNIDGHAACLRRRRARPVAVRPEYRRFEGDAARLRRSGRVPRHDDHHRWPAERPQCPARLHRAARGARGPDGGRRRRRGQALVVFGPWGDELPREAQHDARRTVRARRSKCEAESVHGRRSPERHDVLLRGVRGEHAGRERRLQRSVGHAGHSVGPLDSGVHGADCRGRRRPARGERHDSQRGRWTGAADDDALLPVGQHGHRRWRPRAERRPGGSCAGAGSVGVRQHGADDSRRRPRRHALRDRAGRRR